jgi:hypothetical protein
MDLNICTLVGLRYHIFSTCPPYPYTLYPWAQHTLPSEDLGRRRHHFTGVFLGRVACGL